MKDTMGKKLTESLILEFKYDRERAIYSIKDEDHEDEHGYYPSLKRLYLEVADPTEYAFATRYLLGIGHWLQLANNKRMKPVVEEWRFELEYKLRSAAAAHIIKQAEKGAWQASKWLVDRGWAERPAGRPSNEDVDRETKIMSRMNDEFEADAARLKLVK